MTPEAVPCNRFICNVLRYWLSPFVFVLTLMLFFPFRLTFRANLCTSIVETITYEFLMITLTRLVLINKDCDALQSPRDRN